MEPVIVDNLELCFRWVPRLLNEDQKLRYLEVCQTLAVRFFEEGDTFLSQFIIYDETWVHHYIPESKGACME